MKTKFEIINYYNKFDEWGRLDREPIEFQINRHYIKKHLPKTGYILDNGAGPGKYSMELAKEKIEPFMEAQGFERLELLGSNVGAILNNDNWNYWKDKGEQEFEKTIKLLIEKANDPYILGISSHLLYIGRKKG